MDKIDKAILYQLQRNSKLNTKEIANRVGLSITPTYERIKKFEKQGVIKSYVALLDLDKVGKQVIAFCQISLAIHSIKKLNNFRNNISNLPEVMECYQVTGDYDYIIKITVNTISDLHNFINKKLASIEGISKIRSSVSVDIIKETTAFDLQ
ncbi:MAG: Lrp/AsnC family leucine-responsive transcriptional regulator [Candidatus Marivariicella framensis]|jgi:Lrp/AsnC family leucine-responsive transcriptional regulator|tara:strand:- start:233 stop:688 length:456 start_codon:yes stop_codon:yes gene_type:complete